MRATADNCRTDAVRRIKLDMRTTNLLRKLNMRSPKISGWLGVVCGFGVVVLTWCAIAQAHAHLLKSVPADGHMVATPPASVMLTFSEAARVTAAWIQQGAEGVKTKLAFPERAATEVTIALPALTPGTYVVSWRAASADGHVMPGRIRFTVSPVPASQATQH